MIPKSYYPATSDAGQLFGNIVLPRQSVIRPLSSCLTFIANNMMSLSREELTALFEACAALLPVAVGHTNDARNEKIDIPKANYILREILSFVHRHISDISLSPQTAADAFDISIRYVHKLFAANGTTFNSYVNSKRLDLVSIDLLSPTCRNQPISTLAYRWGFNDLSTFNRLFKARFGSTPSQFRSGGVI
jgi:AraC-like DNA-binding protein